jgi:serine/threonine protein kinase
MTCPSENDIVEYLEQLLSEGEVAKIEHHLDRCASCRQLVVGLISGASAGEVPDEAPTEDGPSTAQSSTHFAAGALPPLLTEVHGRYRDLSVRARGGQAAVYAARDVFLDRDVAIKVLIPNAGGSPDLSSTERIRGTAGAIARFVREARITGRLAHPNVVNVHELGQRADGSLYYSMPLVHGQSLAQALARCEGLAQRLRLLEHFVDLSNAVGYAHSRGVLHRDLKPANVMIGEFGETIVLDWGLAASRGSDEADEPRARGTDVEHGEIGETREGTFLGTPQYASPEQASGRVDTVDERSERSR